MKCSFFIMLSMVMLLACNNQANELDEVNYNKTKESLEEKERNSPLAFLSVSGTDKKNFTGKTVIRGVIENKATVCSYKDVRVKMLFYKEGKLVANHEQVMDDIVKASNNITFKSRYRTPKGTDSVALTIMSALAHVKAD